MRSVRIPEGAAMKERLYEVVAIAVWSLLVLAAAMVP